MNKKCSCSNQRTHAISTSAVPRKSPRANYHFPFLIITAILVLAVLSGCSSLPVKVSPTPVVAGLTEVSSQSQSETPTPTIEPFRFDLPAPGAAPVSGWRPPLYPVPWATTSYDHFYFARPIGADQVNWPLANYRYGGIFDPPFVHTGVDIDAPEGTPILAAGPGTIVWADWGLLRESPGDKSDPYGQAVVIRMDFGYHGQQLYSVYAHMSKILAIVGQHVNTGEVIGLVGHTGHVTGPHVHFEIRLGEDSFYYTYNPELWMAPPEGWGVLVGRITDTSNATLQQLDVYVKNTTSGATHMVKPTAPVRSITTRSIMKIWPSAICRQVCIKSPSTTKGKTSRIGCTFTADR